MDCLNKNRHHTRYSNLVRCDESGPTGTLLTHNNNHHIVTNALDCRSRLDSATRPSMQNQFRATPQYFAQERTTHVGGRIVFTL